VAELSIDDFSLEKHRRIWRRIGDLHNRGERVDHLTVYAELDRNGEAESCGGIGYLVSLDEGLPRIRNLGSYARILREKAALRRIRFAGQNLMDRCAAGETSAEIIEAAQELFTSIGSGGQSQNIGEIPPVSENGAAKVAYIRDPELIRASVTTLTGDAGSGKSTIASAFLRDAIAAGVPGLILDRENPRAAVAERNKRIGLLDSLLYRHWGGWLPTEAPLPDAPAVMDWVKLCDPRPLVVVDSFSAFGPNDQNDAAQTRAFMHRCRRLADLGATVIVIHHDGKAETARDYRGSSDFKASVDVAFHVSNFGPDGHLDRLVLRVYKSRFGLSGELVYHYAGGKFTKGDTGEAQQTVSEQLTALLRLNPGATAKRFEDLAHERQLGRNRARAFLGEGIRSKAVRFEPAANGGRRFFMADTGAQGEM
jgi:hypothetical protein